MQQGQPTAVPPRPAGGTPPLDVAASAGLFIAALLAFISVGAALPVLPTFVRGPLHSSDLAVGIVVGAFAATSVICRPVAGRQADRRGRRVVLVAGSLAMAAGGCMYLFASSVPLLILARLIVGAGEGSVYTAGATWTVDLAPPHRRGLALGLFGLAVWGGLSLGPVAGELLRSGAGYDAVWILTAVLPLIGAGIAACLPEPRTAATGSRTARPGPWLPRAARRPGTALALANVGYAALAGFVVLHLSARGIGGGRRCSRRSPSPYSAAAWSSAAFRTSSGRAGPRRWLRSPRRLGL